MSTHTTGRGLALLTGLLAASGALAILLQDAIRTGIWTIEHGLVPTLMAIAIFTGHLFVSATIQRRALPALGFLVVAIGATWGLLNTSVGKQSSVQAEAVAVAEDVNARRADLMKRLAANQAMLDGARADLARECKSGRGKRCEGITATVKVYEDAVRGNTAELEKIGPQKPINPRADKMSELISAITGRDRETVKGVLVLIEPFTYALIFELAALVSFGFAFGHGRRLPASASDTAQTSFAAPATVAGHDPDPTTPRPRGKRRGPANVPANVVAFPVQPAIVAALEKAGGEVASNHELAVLMGVSDGEASRRVDEAGALVERVRAGKYCRIRLRQTAAVA